jgi:ferredoxin-NADP reductase
MPDDEKSPDLKNICRVVKVIPENHDTASIFLEKPDDGFNRRKAGQFASIRISGQDGWSEPHPFTISGAPEDELIRLTIKKEGIFTSAIQEIRPGAQVKCMGPFGVFCKDIDTRNTIVMIAGGVGITPFLSVLRHFRNISAQNRVTLFWVNKTTRDVICSDEIRDMTRDLNLKVVHSLSREDDVGHYFQQQFPRVVYEKGRLSVDLFRKHEVLNEAAFYLCGPPPMMESALKDLQDLGVQPEHIQQEKFSW